MKTLSSQINFCTLPAKNCEKGAIFDEIMTETWQLTVFGHHVYFIQSLTSLSLSLATAEELDDKNSTVEMEFLYQLQIPQSCSNVKYRTGYYWPLAAI